MGVDNPGPTDSRWRGWRRRTQEEKSPLGGFKEATIGAVLITPINGGVAIGSLAEVEKFIGKKDGANGVSDIQKVKTLLSGDSGNGIKLSFGLIVHFYRGSAPQLQRNKFFVSFGDDETANEKLARELQKPRVRDRNIVDVTMDIAGEKQLDIDIDSVANRLRGILGQGPRRDNELIGKNIARDLSVSQKYILGAANGFRVDLELMGVENTDQWKVEGSKLRCPVATTAEGGKDVTPGIRLIIQHDFGDKPTPGSDKLIAMNKLTEKIAAAFS